RKIILYTLLVIGGLHVRVAAQPRKTQAPGANFKNAEKEFNGQRYMYAVPFYHASLKSGRTNDSLAVLHLAECYWRMKNYDSAIVYYSLYESRYPAIYSSKQRLAELAANRQQYPEAAKTYQRLLKEIPPPAGNLMTERLKGISNVEPFLRDSLDFSIRLLKLNTKQQDFSPQFFRQGMVFVSNRYAKAGAERAFGWDGLPYAHIYWVKDTADLYTVVSVPGRSVRDYEASVKANDDFTDRTSNDNDIINVRSVRGTYTSDIHRLAKFSDNLNARFNYGPLCFNKAGNTVYFTRNSTKPYEGRYNLEICQARMEKGVWSAPIVLPFVQAAFDFYHPAMSEDGQRLYFCSNRPGGLGGSDIYYATLVSDSVKNETFNLGEPINTGGDELFPTINGDQLFFSSDGHAGLGGLDIYESAMDKHNWQAPVNLGYPANSSFDDFGIIYNASRSKGFFSSNRLGTDDIYTFTHMPFVVALKGTVFNKADLRRLDKTKIIIESVEEVPVTDSATTDHTGNFHFPVRPGRTYRLKFWRNGFYDDSVTVKNAGTERELALSPVMLTPIPVETTVQKDRDDDGVPDSKDKCPDEKGSKKNFGCPDIQARFNELAKMVFFKTASAELLPASIRPLTEAYDILLKYSNTTLDIEGHTDNRAGAVYNKDLSHRRANSVKAFFVTRGLNARRFTTAGYGLERPIADNSTEEGRALNRRVAIRATFHE
ncbi:MAG: outer rane lipoprotein Omp16, partial [Sediminibacterium sp.]|nr:outer rane lipoprotein Omp16 [Sediminibacterium sp.]